jgi:PPE family protein
VAANTIAASAAGRLNDNADAYEQQEHDNGRALAEVGGRVPDAVAIVGGSPPSWVPQAATTVPASPGTTPTSGREIAQLIHGGPGPGSLRDAAALLRTHASQLDQAADSIRSARRHNEASWSSDAADAAQTHLANLEASYTGQAERARALARQASTQVENFDRAKSLIPTPQHFDDLERRLVAANKANNAPGSMGRFSGVVAMVQKDLAELNNQAVNGFGGYSAGAAGIETMDVRPKPATTTGGGSGPTFNGTAPTPGGGQGQDPDTVGLGTPGANAADEVLLVPPGGSGDVMSTLLPAVLGGVAGAAGGVLGALSGLGQKLGQAGTQLASGLAQGANSALGSMPSGGGEPEKSGDSGSGDPAGDVGDGGGSDPDGGTEPASSVDGPLSAGPASAAAAPAAAPAMYSSSTPAVALTGTGGGPGMSMGGGLMPAPMMGGRGGGGTGPDDRKLYPERKLKLETPPNSEPVRLRREQRTARTERGDGTP